MRQITLGKSVSSASALVWRAAAISAAMLAVFVSATSLPAHASTNVFDDAVFWFRGGKDLNSDGYIQQGEFFDDLHADDDSHDNHKMSMSSSLYTGSDAGYKVNAVLGKEQVIFPALGTAMTERMRVLRLSNVKGNNKYFPFDVNPYSVFKDNNISNEYTIISRMRLDHDGYKYDTCFAKVGYDASSNKGMWFGFAKSYSDYPGCMRVAALRTPRSGTSNTGVYFDLPVPTNTWVDLAVVVGNGRLRVWVASPMSLESHNNNPTIAFDQKEMWTDNCTLLTSEHYKLFCGDGQTAPAEAADADKSNFSGSVQQLAIWGRALSEQEVMEAFGMPRPAIFRTGFDNGSSNEFGGTRTNSTQIIDGLGSWQGVWNEMRAGDVWTNKFTALRDEANLPQIFSIKSLPDSAAAQIEAKLNGTHLGEGRIAANSRAFWPVAANLVREGENTLVIERKFGGGRDFLIDAMELGGSLGVGMKSGSSTDDGRVDPERISTGVPSAADPNPQHWPTKLESSTSETKHLRFRVWVDPDVADKASFTFKTAVSNDTSSGVAFAVYINNKGKVNVNATNEWKQYTFNPGELNGGWNDFDFRGSSSTCCSEFGYYRFETVLPSPFGFSKWPPLSIVIR